MCNGFHQRLKCLMDRGMGRIKRSHNTFNSRRNFHSSRHRCVHHDGRLSICNTLTYTHGHQCAIDHGNLKMQNGTRHATLHEMLRNGFRETDLYAQNLFCKFRNIASASQRRAKCIDVAKICRKKWSIFFTLRPCTNDGFNSFAHNRFKLSPRLIGRNCVRRKEARTDLIKRFRP